MEEVFGFLGIYLVVLLLIWLFSSVYSIASYVMGSLGTYTIAKRRGIDKPWLAWIPMINAWTLGCISDQYRYVVKGENKSKRKILLGLNIGLIVCIIVFYVFYFVTMFGSMAYIMETGYPEELEMATVGNLSGIFLLYIPMAVLSIISSILSYMAMYDLYASCGPKHNVLFLLLSIFLGIHPFIVFFIRKKDDGMPPRRDPAQTIPPQFDWQQPQQSWQQSAYQDDTHF